MELDNLQDNIILVAALAGLAGLIIGSVVTYLSIGRGPSKAELTGKLAAVEEEFETHKDSVDKHFATTSELVNELTESYVKVYKHLSEGAEQLGGVVDMRHRLTLDDGDAGSTPGDSSAKAEDGSIDGSIIEGALATGVVATAAVGATAQADDPEFTVSDAGVEESLSELEANATSATDSAASPDDPDAVAEALTDIETSANVSSDGKAIKNESDKGKH